MVFQHKRRLELFLELVICIGTPLIIAGLYYIVQGARYEILEEFGCTNAVNTSGVSILVIEAWTIFFPMVSIIFYAPYIIYSFYRRRKEMKEYFDSSDEGLSQSHIYRMLALGCFDTVITLPVTIVVLVVSILHAKPFEFYQGWTYTHSNWGPALIPKNAWSTDKWAVFTVHWGEWLMPFIALVFFTLFGLTQAAKEGYRRLFRFLCKPFGTKQVVGTGEVLPEVVFKTGKQTTATSMSGSSSNTETDVFV